MIRKPFAALSALTLLLASAPASLLRAQEPAQTLNYSSAIVGELLEPLFANWVRAYKKVNPGFRMDYLANPNAAALQAFMDGRTPLTPSTREMTPEEVSAFQQRWGYKPIRIAVARDAVVVLVNRNNPIKELHMEQLDAMYSSTRQRGWPKPVDTWGDLGLSAKDWATRPIERWGHPSDSGTLVFFRNVVELGAQERPDIHRGSDVAFMVENIMSNQAVIGYGSFSQICSTIKAVPLIPQGTKDPIEPTTSTVADGSYPLGRFLYIYLNKPAGKPLDPGIKGFLSFVLSPEGQATIPAVGFVPMVSDMAALQTRQLGN
nr:substrate-binding domain-containing protein [uncultured Holophaga sp.]